MKLRDWDDLPDKMRNERVREYYEILQRKRIELILKRVFDIIASIILLFFLLPILVAISIAIKLDSQGPVMFRQVRVTQFMKHFRIFKFRTMVHNAERLGTEVTTKNDVRITRVGKILRRLRLDELPQLLNIISGDMSFVGTRPEVVRYVEKYTDEMMATLLLPAGVTSEASIQYKDEELLLSTAADADDTYIYEVLPTKMKHNLKSIEEFSFFCDIKTMIKTVMVVFGKE